MEGYNFAYLDERTNLSAAPPEPSHPRHQVQFGSRRCRWLGWGTGGIQVTDACSPHDALRSSTAATTPQRSQHRQFFARTTA